MIIEITLQSGSQYEIKMEGAQITLTKVSVIKDTESKNYGNKKLTELGYYTQLPLALKRIVREEVSSSEDKVTLDEYIERIQAINKELMDAMEGYGL